MALTHLRREVAHRLACVRPRPAPGRIHRPCLSGRRVLDSGSQSRNSRRRSVSGLKHPATFLAALALFVALGSGAAVGSSLISGRQLLDHSIPKSKLTSRAVAVLEGRDRAASGGRSVFLRDMKGAGAMATGAAGSKGKTGATGLQGPRGAIGPRGLQGPRGATGPRGLQGTAGPSADQALAQASGLVAWTTDPALMSTKVADSSGAIHGASVWLNQ